MKILVISKNRNSFIEQKWRVGGSLQIQIQKFKSSYSDFLKIHYKQNALKSCLVFQELLSLSFNFITIIWIVSKKINKILKILSISVCKVTQFFKKAWILMLFLKKLTLDKQDTVFIGFNKSNTSVSFSLTTSFSDVSSSCSWGNKHWNSWPFLDVIYTAG